MFPWAFPLNFILGIEVSCPKSNASKRHFLSFSQIKRNCCPWLIHRLINRRCCPRQNCGDVLKAVSVSHASVTRPIVEKKILRHKSCEHWFGFWVSKMMDIAVFFLPTPDANKNVRRIMTITCRWIPLPLRTYNPVESDKNALQSPKGNSHFRMKQNKRETWVNWVK